MENLQRSERASILTSRMSSYARTKFKLGDGVPLLAGLPVGSTLHRDAGLVVSPSCCTLNLFADPMKTVSEARDCDVVLMRHGLHPESFDDVLFDVILRVRHDRLMLRDLRLFLDEVGRAWLVPDRAGPYLGMSEAGIALSFEAPFITHSQRSDGLNRAARQIVRAASRMVACHG